MEDKRLLRLVKKARRGDKEAFRALIQEKGRKIVYIATNLMGNSADGEDAAQEAVLTVARKINTLENVELFDAWLYRIVYNVCMDEKRRKKKFATENGDMETAMATISDEDVSIQPENKMEDDVERERIMAAINELPERYRVCMLLYYYEDMSYLEIAKTLQVSEQVVANTLNRAKAKLRHILEEQGSLSETEIDEQLGVEDNGFDTQDIPYQDEIGAPAQAWA